MRGKAKVDVARMTDVALWKLLDETLRRIDRDITSYGSYREIRTDVRIAVQVAAELKLRGTQLTLAS